MVGQKPKQVNPETQKRVEGILDEARAKGGVNSTWEIKYFWKVLTFNRVRRSSRCILFRLLVGHFGLNEEFALRIVNILKPQKPSMKSRQERKDRRKMPMPPSLQHQM